MAQTVLTLLSYGLLVVLVYVFWAMLSPARSPADNTATPRSAEAGCLIAVLIVIGILIAATFVRESDLHQGGSDRDAPIGRTFGGDTY